jgi:hypothetical protein
MVQEFADLWLGGNAKQFLQVVTGLGKRLYHVDGAGGHALANESADDGAGHIATTNKCNSLSHSFLQIRQKARMLVAVRHHCGSAMYGLRPGRMNYFKKYFVLAPKK